MHFDIFKKLIEKRFSYGIKLFLYLYIKVAISMNINNIYSKNKSETCK